MSAAQMDKPSKGARIMVAAGRSFGEIPTARSRVVVIGCEFRFFRAGMASAWVGAVNRRLTGCGAE